MLGDVIALVLGALGAHRLRTRLTVLAVAIGVASVLLLTALGEGARDWIAARFAALGSNLLVVMPGRTETRGGAPMAPASTRDLTLEDALAIPRRLPGVRRVVPIVVGESTAAHEGRGRSATVIGAAPGYLAIRDIAPAFGTDLPEGDPRAGERVCVIGHTIRRELFGDASPLGARLKLGDYPFRVVGVLGAEGTSMMMNLDEVVIVPVSSAMRMFNRTGLFRVIVSLSAAADVDLARRRLEAVLKERHDGEEDFTVLHPGAVAASLDAIVGIITAALAGIAAISLAVAGIGVMNVMVVSVAERTGEIGLMKAVGASDAQVTALFLCEAVVLTLAGGLAGVAAGFALAEGARALYPAIPFRVPIWSLGLALAVAVGVGLVFGIAPAVRAARLEPLDALRRRL